MNDRHSAGVGGEEILRCSIAKADNQLEPNGDKPEHGLEKTRDEAEPEQAEAEPWHGDIVAEDGLMKTGACRTRGMEHQARGRPESSCNAGRRLCARRGSGECRTDMWTAPRS